MTHKLQLSASRAQLTIIFYNRLGPGHQLLLIEYICKIPCSSDPKVLAPAGYPMCPLSVIITSGRVLLLPQTQTFYFTNGLHTSSWCLQRTVVLVVFYGSTKQLFGSLFSIDETRKWMSNDSLNFVLQTSQSLGKYWIYLDGTPQTIFILNDVTDIIFGFISSLVFFASFLAASAKSSPAEA